MKSISEIVIEVITQCVPKISIGDANTIADAVQRRVDREQHQFRTSKTDDNMGARLAHIERFLTDGFACWPMAKFDA